MNSPVLIAFGANIAPEENLAAGIARLHATVRVRAISTVYRTPALVDANAPIQAPLPDFLNGALCIEGGCEPLGLRELLKKIEREQGRQPGQPGWAPRPLDFDIALMGEARFDQEGLTIPDPDIPKRDFLAVPLAELAPELIHPLLGEPMVQVAARFLGHTASMRPDPTATARLRAIISL
ncbi:2-amino-4-hydroxy-6-hydroxymethyldihydropteridine pyrophosphokinase [Candidatus Magnetaquicoccaceae bacterium FCR-1]|uniref:2-amino-4-hydroxy-6-hydroxymethyldihydropteridine pyrophosphokinase n=1 Tax=Candidatus Magnetaquiglobus chichijimensis TaxID=3141448 RepID=A0ABQ0C4K1_9PROT